MSDVERVVMVVVAVGIGGLPETEASGAFMGLSPTGSSAVVIRARRTQPRVWWVRT